MEDIIARARQTNSALFCPGSERRTIQAADQLIGDDVAHIILLGNRGNCRIGLGVESKHIKSATIIDRKTMIKKKSMQICFSASAEKGMTPEKAAGWWKIPIWPV